MATLEALTEFIGSGGLGDVPEAVISHSKQVLIDALGCIVLGYDGEASKAARRTVTQLACSGNSTLIGDGITAPPMLAALANGVALRHTEYNDVYLGTRGLVHPSEVIPTALAVAEHVKASGAEALSAIALGLEIHARIADFVAIEEQGWHHTTFGGLVTAAVSARLLGLDAARTRQAVAVACSYGFATRELHSGALSMMRSLAYPLASYTGIMAALLSAEGFTAPNSALDGEAGLLHQLGLSRDALDGAFESDRWHLTQRSALKRYACSTIGQSAVSAVIRLVIEHDLEPADIEHIAVRTFKMAVDIGGTAERRFPTTKESADHSMHYYLAAAAVDHEVGPAQFERERIFAPEIRSMIPRISVQWDPALDSAWPKARPAIVEILTSDGRRLGLREDSPPGSPDRPLTDAELQAKFSIVTASHLGHERQEAIWRGVFSIERLTDIGPLMQLLTFQ